MRRVIARYTVKPGQEGVTDGIAGRCEVPPQTAETDQIGSYRLFGS